MKNVSSSGRLIQNLSEDEGSLKSWKLYMSSIMRHCLVMAILGDFPFLLGCILGQVITTAISVGRLVLVFFMVQRSVKRFLSHHGSWQNSSAKQGMYFKCALKNNEGALLAVPDILVFDKGCRSLKLFRWRGTFSLSECQISWVRADSFIKRTALSVSGENID